MLASVVLNHVPVVNFDFRTKCTFVCHVIRRVLLTHQDRTQLDDKDYYGNKRLELAGQLLSLLFEDLFKRLNVQLKKQADQGLSKPNRTQSFDVIKCIRDRHHHQRLHPGHRHGQLEAAALPHGPPGRDAGADAALLHLLPRA